MIPVLAKFKTNEQTKKLTNKGFNNILDATSNLQNRHDEK
jgi:hypothetical protein